MNGRTSIERRRSRRREGKGTNPIAKAFEVASFAALFVSFAGYALFALNLSTLSPVDLLRPFLAVPVRITPAHVFLSFLLVWGTSLLFALAYVYTLGRRPWPYFGIVFGLFLGFLLVGREADARTLATVYSLSVLYGLFLTYSLTVEFTNPERGGSA
ncbi:MAG: hypothetical protein BLITH_1337 [Brockia lithotrophica]|uniref:Uncharacterized protein n=1 Tax=Brockia lithotrophica TaxID=933949 RepID=A0A2T5G694_9BACL|nr:hypothetical protein [Brockia lithotrophica]MBT9252398.1 hypothetical protein [Brockia lithotrophica]PTQ51699.1 MAG: hypothetical protein BLITH_1337 [Brockia lithotrophica]